MAFFRKWKTHYKHKKFTSDDAIDGEDWGLETNVKHLPNVDDMKLDLNEFNDEAALDGSNDSGNGNESDEDHKPPTSTYDIKYLGCTPIDSKRSEKVTSEAIKTVIANSKAGGRKNKTLKRVKLTVSPDRGIEVCDPQTLDTLMRFSIYKVSYCSVDAAHDHAFSFVGSEVDPITEEERMSCHVFQCPKRKIAHEITLNVARCFENAYQQWRDAVMRNAKRQGMSVDGSADGRKVLKEHNGCGSIESHVEVHEQKQQQQQPKQQPKDEKKSEDLLIDLASTDFGKVAGNDVRQYLQNTWVSFEDDPRESGVHLIAC